MRKPEISRGNCLGFALRRWFAAGTGNSYLIIRKSRLTWLPHIMWAPSIENTYVEEYKPAFELTRFQRWFPFIAIRFRGRVRKGVGEEH